MVLLLKRYRSRYRSSYRPEDLLASCPKVIYENIELKSMYEGLVKQLTAIQGLLALSNVSQTIQELLHPEKVI